MRATFLPFAQPDLDGDELTAIAEAIASGWITSGPQATQFEVTFAAAVGAPYALALNSCTAAMHLALEAIGLQTGDEVITSPYTFAATAEVVHYFGARPVFVDVDPVTLNIDPALIAAAITPHTRAIIPVHVAGLPAELDPIYEIADRYRLAVVEDAAHAFPAAYKGRPIGSPPPLNAGRPPSAVCFSFYATKSITTGEGGMLVTADEALAERARVMALHGMSKDAWNRYSANGSWYYEIVAPGFKYNMTDIAAAMGLAQLSKARQMWVRRQAIAARYDEAFANCPALQLPANDNRCQHAWHLYMLRLHLDRVRIGRDRFLEELSAFNIGGSVHFIPLHLHPYYRHTYGYRPHDFPVAYLEYCRELSLPIYSRMNDGDVQDVIEAVLMLAEAYLV